VNSPTVRPFGELANDLADKASAGAESAIRSTQRAATDSIDQLSQTADRMRDKTVPVIDRLAERAEDLARRSIGSIRDGSKQIAERAQTATNNTIEYIRDEPVKSVILSAVLGAGLMAIFAMLTRSGRRD
jgi:ElaB/YqjD/DUF883 family membrane-anchored ribosome-binding protein